VIERNWYKCYGEGWTGMIIPDAFAHPAKFSRALIRRIYQHAIEQGYLTEGDTVLDPFGGVALGGLHAMRNGLHWVGVELEEKFVTLGGQNIDLWDEQFGRMPRWGTATLVQGDSRELGNVLVEAGGVVSSPPYAETAVEKSSDGVDLRKQYNTYQEQGGGASFEAFCATQRLHSQGYGGSDGQMAAMKPGSHATIVSSPPYADGCAHTGGNDPNPEHVKGGKLYGVGIAGAISSPPYSESLASDDPDKRGGLFRDPRRRSDKTLTAEYGETPGQLGGMKAGEFGAVVGSPLFQQSVSRDTVDKDARVALARQLGISNAKHITAIDMEKVGQRTQRYGNTDGQLGQMNGGDFEAVVSSPPWEGTLESGEGLDVNKLYDGMVDRHGRSGSDSDRQKQVELMTKRIQGREYGESDGQLGQDEGETFWAAARQIMEQCYQVLAPGAVAIWVLKSFVRNKQIVDFPDQWRQLGEACGFESVEWIRAWLVEDRGKQWDLWGNLEERRVERKSFFRRLAEKNGSPRIDYEVVLVQRKPEGNR